MDPEGRGNEKEEGGVEEGETIIRLYYIRKEFTFNKREKVNMFCELFLKTMDKI